MPRKTKPTETTGAGPSHNSIDRDRLHSLVKRIELIESGRAELASDIRDVSPRPSPPGFDAQALRQVIRMRKQDRTERAERQAVTRPIASARASWFEHDRQVSVRRRSL